ncbi:MAG TPA: 3-isopropylmalate dehydratase [Candidatus Omnitrophica bacterium]|nr:3-isopropylmalate dehydratase [Candidatus Omnitrophota bacterium]
MKIKGSALKLGNDVNTDLIISGRYKFAITDINELAKHVMEDLDPHFFKRIKPGKSIIVAGENFGCGSSREQALLAIKAAGITAVVAKSFARIFYRNAFNIGLALIEADTRNIKEGDVISVDLNRGMITNQNSSKQITIKPIAPVLRKLLADGGLVKHYIKHKGLKL